MTTDKNIRMTFICGQDWAAMTPTENGRFCEMCRKEVYDFTTKSVQSIDSLRLEKGEGLCGRFNIEQVDRTLIKPIETPKRIKFFAFVSTLIFSITAKTTFSQTIGPAKTEQIVKTGTEGKNDFTTDTSDTTSEDETGKTEFADRIFFMETKKRKYYWTKKIPFIKSVRVRRQLIGRFD